MGRIQEIFARVGRRLKDEGQRSYQLEDFLSDLYAAEKDIVAGPACSSRSCRSRSWPALTRTHLPNRSGR